MDGRTGGIFRRGRLCCHCLLVETEQGLVLIDTGFGLEDVRNPQARLSCLFLALLSPDFREEMTAVRQIERLGWSASDVRHIVLTHLDFDHAGGLDDFPNAQVHLLEQEQQGALAQTTWLDRQRYRPQQWRSRSRWRTYRVADGERWLGFEAVRQLDGLPPEILLVPLIGHTLGHAGVAIERHNSWTLQTGDAYLCRGEMDLSRPHCTPGLQTYQTLMEKDRRQRLWNQERLRELKRAQAKQLDLMCSHDPQEFEVLAGRPMGMPAIQPSFAA